MRSALVSAEMIEMIEEMPTSPVSMATQATSLPKSVDGTSSPSASVGFELAPLSGLQRQGKWRSERAR